MLGQIGKNMELKLFILRILMRENKLLLAQELFID